MDTDENSVSCLNYIYWTATVYVLVQVLCKVWSFTKDYVLPRYKEPQDFRKYGQWAVITGSTDGIGKGFAEELASKGVDICLISRNEEKLRNVAKEIEKSHGVKTKYIVADFTNPDVYGHIKKSMSDLDIGILVNNVGIADEAFKPFSTFNEVVIKDYINVNLMSLTMMTHLALPSMMAKKRGLILNMSSVGSEIIFPYAAEYCGCKAFITMFGSCLSYELKKHNIQVTTFIPGGINTSLMQKYPNLMKLVKFSSIAPVKKFVKSALLTVSSGSYKTCGYLAHYFALAGLQLVPTALISMVLVYWNKIK